MTSRYDRRDPGEDPDYCDALAYEEADDVDEPAEANALQRIAPPVTRLGDFVTVSLDAVRDALLTILAQRRGAERVDEVRS